MTPAIFWSRVDKSHGENECWPWSSNSGSGGYGYVIYQREQWMAHRLAFFLEYGWIPDVVGHHCENRACCNPKHLFGGTHGENMADRKVKGWHAKVLSWPNVEGLRRAYENGASMSDLAREY